jgi:hypothetical protein
MNLKLVLLLSFIALSSCISEIDSLSDVSPKAVVYCVFEEGKPWNLTLQLSQKFSDTNLPNEITNASVLISGSDGSLRNLTHLGGGFYWSNQSLPQRNVTYTLKIIIAGYPQITSFAKLPSKENIQILASNNASMFRLVRSDTTQTLYTQVKLYEGSFNAWENFIGYNLSSFTILSPELQEQVKDQYQGSVLQFGDDYTLDKFIGRIHQREILLTSGIQKEHAEVLQLEKQGYDFFLYQKKQRRLEEDLLAEPLPFKGSIENGYGIFTGTHRFNWSVNPIPSPEQIAGTYQLTTYNQTINQVGRNYPEANGYLKLFADGRLEGGMKRSLTEEMVVLNGGWKLTDHKIRLYFSAKNFLKEINIVWQGQSLSAVFSPSPLQNANAQFSKISE